jgi:hypothetical protein
MLPKFYRTKSEFKTIHSLLKQKSCPHCQKRGTLILHGYLCGYDLRRPGHRVLRGHRIFCSNRDCKQGCGKTFSILRSIVLKGFIIQSSHLWIFLRNISRLKNKRQAFTLLSGFLSSTTIYRLYRRVFAQKSVIKRRLIRYDPFNSDKNTQNTLIEMILLIKAVFKSNRNPVSAFQVTFQTSFL